MKILVKRIDENFTDKTVAENSTKKAVAARTNSLHVIFIVVLANHH